MKLTAVVQTNLPESSKRLKGKLDNNDNDNDPFHAAIEKILNDNKDNDNNDNDNDDRDGENDSGNTTGWINQWINQPAGKRGQKNQDGWLGWGKPKILMTAGITEDQYTIYMVCISCSYTC